ncbi:Sushi/SCR/CCP domain [Trinorchestia longiramus]|nr:Sushi/SCR/CCP domain [Trinorchestia longiramus]
MLPKLVFMLLQLHRDGMHGLNPSSSLARRQRLPRGEAFSWHCGHLHLHTWLPVSVTYTCIPGFRSPNETNMTVICKLGNWTSPTPGWSCTNIHSMNLADILKGEMDIPDDELTDEEKQRKLAMATENYYFWIVTIPSIVGLSLSIFLCLCCTRTDSPLFNLCGGYKKNAFGYEDMKTNRRMN